MNKINNIKLLLNLAVLLLFLISFSSCTPKNTKKGNLKPIRIGWQVAWATQGQLSQVLQHTNALELMGLKGDFKSFTYGAPLSEAALAGELDVAFLGDQPAINLVSKSNDWKIVARLMDFRVAIVIPMNSPIKSISDLKGKTLGIPFGASTHRVALQMLKEAGLDPQNDLRIINIDILEQSDIINVGGDTSWSKIDAFATWDHHIALYENKGMAKILKSGTALGLIAMSDNFIKSNPDAAASFITAFKLAYLYYAKNEQQSNLWFIKATGVKFDAQLLNKVAEIEPNLKVKDIDSINISLSKRNVYTLKSATDFAFNHHLIKNQINIENFIDTSIIPNNDNNIEQNLLELIKVK